MSPNHLTKVALSFLSATFLFSDQMMAAGGTETWKEFRPIGGHFSVRIPEFVDTVVDPDTTNVMIRTWKIPSGSTTYKIVAFYSPEIDSSYSDTFLKTIVDKEHSTHKKISIGGFPADEIVLEKTEKHLAERRWFHASLHHAVMFCETAPDVPDANDDFFKSIKIEDNRKDPMMTIHHPESGVSFLFPVQHEGDNNGLWKGKDNDHSYMVEVEHYARKQSNEEQLEALEAFANSAEKNRIKDKVKKVQGLNAREFSSGSRNYLAISSPWWSYIFLCTIQDEDEPTIKGKDDFFNSIVINPIK